MTHSRVVVTGLGTVSPLGVGVRHAWKQLIAGKSGIISTDTLDEKYRGIPSKVVGAIPKGPITEGKWDPFDHLKAPEVRRCALFVQYALAATGEALKDANWHPQSTKDQEKTGVCIGSGVGGMYDTYDAFHTFESKGYKSVQPLLIPRQLASMAAGLVSIHFKLKGLNHSVSTACATGNHAIGDAYRFIKDGYAKVVVAGATESSIHPLSLAGFARAKSLATKFNDEPTKASRPFDKNRNGFVLSEGSGIVVLEELEHAKARNANIYAEVIGYGLSGDGYHITAPSPDASGARRAMEMALKDIDKNLVGYVNAHATSTPLGDRLEGLAISNVFKENNDVHVSSTKGSTGHLLGAAGALESIFTILALKESTLPQTLNLEEADVELTKDFRLKLVANEPLQKGIEYALNNGFGFGGTNSSVLFKRYG